MKNRKIESLGPQITQIKSLEDNQLLQNELMNSIAILCSPSDIGVRRNKGRNGARFAPSGIIASLKKLNAHHLEKSINYKLIDVTKQETEASDFHQAQDTSSSQIKEILLNSSYHFKVHLGGGHDHAYPLLKAIDESKKYDQIIIINIDAHCDTRIDDQRHSGTPFRDFDQLAPKTPTSMIQYGLHHFSNSVSTMSPLKHVKERKTLLSEVANRTAQFTKRDERVLEDIKSLLTSKTALFFSLDADAIDGSQMPAVSAPNPEGFPFAFIKSLLIQLQESFLLDAKQKAELDLYLGIYEYNPVYDTRAATAAKMLATLIYELEA